MSPRPHFMPDYGADFSVFNPRKPASQTVELQPFTISVENATVTEAAGSFHVVVRARGVDVHSGVRANFSFNKSYPTACVRGQADMALRLAVGEFMLHEADEHWRTGDLGEGYGPDFRPLKWDPHEGGSRPFEASLDENAEPCFQLKPAPDPFFKVVFKEVGK